MARRIKSDGREPPPRGNTIVPRGGPAPLGRGVAALATLLCAAAGGPGHSGRRTRRSIDKSPFASLRRLAPARQDPDVAVQVGGTLRHVVVGEGRAGEPAQVTTQLLHTLGRGATVGDWAGVSLHWRAGNRARHTHEGRRGRRGAGYRRAHAADLGLPYSPLSDLLGIVPAPR